jgi:transposase
MMGQLPAAQNALFYDFCLERHIPPDDLLRHIDQFLDFDSIRQHLEPFYSFTGRPSIDPELMIRMLLVGYCYGIRSERRLCDEVNFNLAYRWFCRIGLEDDVPDHSTFSKNRHGRYRDSDLFRYVFDTVVQRCMGEGLVRGEGFAIDASLIRADVSRQRAVRSDEPVDWGPASTQTRAVREYFEALDENPALRRSQKRLPLTDPMAQWSREGPR